MLSADENDEAYADVWSAREGFLDPSPPIEVPLQRRYCTLQKKKKEYPPLDSLPTTSERLEQPRAVRVRRLLAAVPASVSAGPRPVALGARLPIASFGIGITLPLANAPRLTRTLVPSSKNIRHTRTGAPVTGSASATLL